MIIILLLSVSGIIAGVGLLKFYPRILTIVLSALNLLNIPIGTALGVYGLWVLPSGRAALCAPRQSGERN